MKEITVNGLGGICIWLFCITVNTCTISEAINKNTEAIKTLAQQPRLIGRVTLKPTTECNGEECDDL